jgi:hypothetical protein
LWNLKGPKEPDGSALSMQLFLREDEKGKLHSKETADMRGGKGATIGSVTGAAKGLIIPTRCGHGMLAILCYPPGDRMVSGGNFLVSLAKQQSASRASAEVRIVKINRQRIVKMESNSKI